LKILPEKQISFMAASMGSAQRPDAPFIESQQGNRKFNSFAGNMH
jgi:hypothetical protein